MMRGSSIKLIASVIIVLFAFTCFLHADEMIIGWYGSNEEPNDMNEMQLHGANIVMAYNLHGPGNEIIARNYLNYAGSIGYNVLMELPFGEVRIADIAKITDHVNRFKNYSAVKMWQMHDEPETQGVAEANFIASYQAVKAADPCHPVSCVFANHELGGFINGVDVPAWDNYPALASTTSPSERLYEVAHGIKRVSEQAAAAGKQAPIYVAQAFEMAGNEPWIFRLPTYFETRYMTFAPFTVGAQGIMYWLFPENMPGLTYEQSPHCPASHRQNVVYPLINDLKTIEKQILSNLGNGGVSVSSNQDFQVLGHGVNNLTYIIRKYTLNGYNDYYLIVANNSGGNLSAAHLTLTGLPVYGYQVQELFQSPSTFSFVQSGSNYVLTDDFDNYEVHIYKIRGGQTTAGTCGDVNHPYPVGDVNQDCSVNMEDFSELASNWLNCNDPEGCN